MSISHYIFQHHPLLHLFFPHEHHNELAELVKIYLVALGLVHLTDEGPHALFPLIEVEPGDELPYLLHPGPERRRG